MTDLHQNLLIDLNDSENLPTVNKKVTLLRKIKTFLTKVLFYLNKKWTQKYNVELKRVAVHEAGHVVAGYFTEHKVRFVTIAPTEEPNFGVTMFNPRKSQGMVYDPIFASGHLLCGKSGRRTIFRTITRTWWRSTIY